MIQDFDAPGFSPDRPFRLCIVGAGPAGIALARHFAGMPFDVVLLEQGGLELDDAQFLAEGETGAIEYLPLASTRLFFFGGTTGHWSGQSVPLDPTDFERRDWVEHSGWPIGYEAYASHLAEAQALCRLPEPEGWQPLADRLEHRTFPLAGGRFEPVFLKFPPVLDGDPGNSARFGEVYRADIERATNVLCLLHAHVLRLVPDPQGRRIQSLEIGSLAGRRATIRADIVIVAGGAIENARLLLLSQRAAEAGFGALDDQVGRYFMEHPNLDTGEIRFAATEDARFLAEPWVEEGSLLVRRDVRLPTEAQAELGILNHTAYLRRSWPTENELSNPIARVERLWQRGVAKVYDDVLGEAFLAQMWRDQYALRIRLEHAPNPESRVRLAEATDPFGQPQALLDLRFGELEARTLEVVERAFAEALGQSELGRMRTAFDPADRSWPDRAGWQYHHCGGTRMSADPRTGVVDPNGRVHGMDNLYIAGSSVFPTSGHANPTMNLLALTLRLATHLEETELA